MDLCPCQVYDARFKHPFNMLVNGPTRAGKSTFVQSLLTEHQDLIDCEFDYINIFLGTKENDNQMVQGIRARYPGKHINVVEDVKGLYDGDEKVMKKQFPELFNSMLLDNVYKGLVIFDDLMTELANCDLLVPLFTKWSSHLNLSTIYITQNMFYHGSGKHQSDCSTLYRNTKYIVLFACPLDISIIQTVARRFPGDTKVLTEMMQKYTEKYKYVLITGDPNLPDIFRIRTNLFGVKEGGLRYQLLIKLDTNQTEIKSCIP